MIVVFVVILSILGCNEKKEISQQMSADPVLERPFVFDSSCNMEDPVLRKIMKEDMKGKKNPLELLHDYAETLNSRSSHGDIDERMDRLFLYGKAPQRVEGYYHGITISLKTGLDIYATLEETRKKLAIGNELDVTQSLYGTVLSKSSPWAGKSFTKLTPEKQQQMTGGKAFDGPSWIGINSFRKDEKAVVNNLAGTLLPIIMDLEQIPDTENSQRSWLNARGGRFIARQQMSVNPETPDKKVMALNYRWESLKNRLPNRLLVDEIVEIAQGLYLGKLYYATAGKNIFSKYNGDLSSEQYKYRNFGYFALMDDTWLAEKNRLFPGLQYSPAEDTKEKFTTFTFVDCKACEEVRQLLGDRKTILHYLRDINNGIKQGPGFQDDSFAELQKIFSCGVLPESIDGFFHGGVVTFKNAGFLKKFDRNGMNDIYPAVRPFSPWTGKTFSRISGENLKQYIGKNASYYREKSPVILGSNTYGKRIDLSMPVTAFIERLDHIGMAVEYPDEQEKRREIYVKSFYFVATNEKSVNPENNGKQVLRLNYRWPELNTLPPDHLCYDELVQIADGLYLGQLLYSTKPEIPYDPASEDAVYQYENFGYFMLMDEDWFAVREFIQFDTGH